MSKSKSGPDSTEELSQFPVHNSRERGSTEYSCSRKNAAICPLPLSISHGELFTVKWKALSLSTFCFHTSWSCFFVLQFLLNKVSKWKAFFEIGPCSYLHFLTLFNIYAFPWVWFQRFITSLIVPVSIRTNASVNPLSIIAGVIFVKTRIEG